MRRLLAITLRLLLGLGALAVLAGSFGYSWLDRHILSTLPDDLSEFREWRPPTACSVYDAEGNRIDTFYVERRIWRDIDTLPEHVWQAFIAAEDRRFFDHPGIDLFGVARAMWVNIRKGSVSQGGSTITQQLVKKLLVGEERSYERKVKEAVLAYRLERELTKMEILELYVNFVFLGAGNYGVEAAAQDYFGVSADQLDPGQAALIAGLVPAPSRYNPRRNAEEARMRRAIVLRAMVDEYYVDPIDAIDYQTDPVIARGGRTAPGGPEVAYATLVRREIRRLVGEEVAYQQGLHVFTPYDADVQQVALKAVRDAVDGVQLRQGIRPEGAAIVLENATGRIVALVGGTDVGLEGFIRAVQARRQPGSSFKPYVYAVALQNGMTQLDVVQDAPLFLPAGGGKTWSPQNYGGGFAGPVRLRTALTKSLNTVSVRLVLQNGPAEVARMAARMGVRTPIRQDPTIALGSSEVTPMDQVLGYATIARMGVPTEPVYVDRLEDSMGNVIGVRGGPVVVHGRTLTTLPGAPEPRALPGGISYELLDMMREVVQSGTAIRAKEADFDRAGKTGTTNDFIDAWFVGFTPRYTVGVWIGAESEKSLGDKETGGKTALPAWLSIVHALDQPAGERFAIPDDAILVKVGDRWMGFPRGGVPREALAWRAPGPEPLPSFPVSRHATPLEDSRDESPADPARRRRPGRDGVQEEARGRSD